VKFGPAVIVEVERLVVIECDLEPPASCKRVECDECGDMLLRRRALNCDQQWTAERWVKCIGKRLAEIGGLQCKVPRFMCVTCLSVEPSNKPPHQLPATQAGSDRTSACEAAPAEDGAGGRDCDLIEEEDYDEDMEMVDWSFEIPSAKRLRSLRAYRALVHHLIEHELDDLCATSFCLSVARSIRSLALAAAGPRALAKGLAGVLQERGRWCGPLLRAVAIEYLQRHGRSAAPSPGIAQPPAAPAPAASSSGALLGPGRGGGTSAERGEATWETLDWESLEDTAEDLIPLANPCPVRPSTGWDA